MESKRKVAFWDDPKGMHLAEEEDLDPARYPGIFSIPGGGALFRCIPCPKNPLPPEYVQVPVADGSPKHLELTGVLAAWNFAWEAAELRPHVAGEDLPAEWSWVANYPDRNLYLIPRADTHPYTAYAPLYHLLPRAILERHRLPLFKRGVWPFVIVGPGSADSLVDRDFLPRLSQALAHHVWPLLCSGSPVSAFDPSEPIRLLAHNLDFWLPYANIVIEERLRQLGRVPIENAEHAALLRRVRRSTPRDYRVVRLLRGGDVWSGEEDARVATRGMVERADAGGRLRGILEAVRASRVEDDFSDRWSYAREDFERRLYRKRNKVRVSFVELSDTIPVQGPEAEVHENLLWEDFLGLLDTRERRVTVLLRSGVTKVAEISQILGYANHSPVSKALARIRQRVVEFLD